MDIHLDTARVQWLLKQTKTRHAAQQYGSAGTRYRKGLHREEFLFQDLRESLPGEMSGVFSGIAGEFCWRRMLIDAGIAVEWDYKATPLKGDSGVDLSVFDDIVLQVKTRTKRKNLTTGEWYKTTLIQSRYIDGNPLNYRSRFYLCSEYDHDRSLVSLVGWCTLPMLKSLSDEKSIYDHYNWKVHDDFLIAAELLPGASISFSKRAKCSHAS